MIHERNLEFLWDNLVKPIYTAMSPVIGRVVGLCKKKENPENFIPACTSGNIEKIKKIRSQFTVDLNTGLTEAVKAGQDMTAIYLIKEGATNLDENLKFACANNKYGLAEMLVQNGAKTIVGLRVAKSPNIIKMLHRYEQNSELINY